MSTRETKKTATSGDIENIDKILSRSDDFRKMGLAQVQQLQTVKSRSLEREKQRLSEKLGVDHPRVKAIAARLEFNTNRMSVLKKEINKLDIKVADVDQKTVMIHGRILDKHQQPLPGLTAALADEKGKWIRAYGYSSSDEKGYFSIKVAPDQTQKEDVIETVYLLVTDRAQKVLYLDKAGIVPAVGRIHYREVVLKKITAPTPPVGDDENVILDPDVWKVLGRVRNRKQEPMKNVSISLYDKDLIFDDHLGTTVTDDKGEFELLYRTEDFRDLIEARPDLYLDVIDENGQILYTTKKAFRFSAKRVEQFDITIATAANAEEQLEEKTEGKQKVSSEQVKKAKPKKKIPGIDKKNTRKRPGK